MPEKMRNKIFFKWVCCISAKAFLKIKALLITQINTTDVRMARAVSLLKSFMPNLASTEVMPAKNIEMMA